MRAGFTLIEVLVAFTILALGLVLIQETFSGSTRSRVKAQDRAEAQALASSLMALAGAVYREPGTFSGEDANGRAWRLESKRLERPEGPALALPLFELEVNVATVSWGGQPSELSLKTVKIVDPP